MRIVSYTDFFFRPKWESAIHQSLASLTLKDRESGTYIKIGYKVFNNCLDYHVLKVFNMFKACMHEFVVLD